MPIGCAAVVAAALLVAGCGGDGDGDTVEVEGRGTYTLEKVESAASGDELAELLGTPQTPPSPLPGGFSQQYREPSSGNYVAVTVGFDAADEDGGDGGGDEEAPVVLVDGSGEEHEPGLTQFGLDVEAASEGDGPGVSTLTFVYDLPASALEGAVLEIEGEGSSGTIDLGP